jgi:hypothetical protein
MARNNQALKNQVLQPGDYQHASTLYCFKICIADAAHDMEWITLGGSFAAHSLLGAKHRLPPVFLNPYCLIIFPEGASRRPRQHACSLSGNHSQKTAGERKVERSQRTPFYKASDIRIAFISWECPLSSPSPTILIVANLAQTSVTYINVWTPCPLRSRS